MRARPGAASLVPLSLVVASLAFAGCNGSSESGPQPAFSTADLAGVWHYDLLFAGSTVAAGTAPGWARGTVSIDTAGSSSVLTFEDSTGSTTAPALPPITYTLSGGGIVTATTTAFTGTHGRMNGAKDLFVTTATQGVGAQARVRLVVFQRVVPGVTYGPEDVASTSFSLHQLAYGASGGWLHADLGVGGDGVHGLTNVVTHAGPGADVPAQGTLHVSPDGVVTTSAAPTFRGFLSADKRLLVGIQSNGPADHALSVLVRRGGAFAATDAAGTWDYADVAVAPSLGMAAWGHGAVTISASGVATFGPQTDSLGGTATPPPETFALAADGTFTHVPADDFHGTVAPAKDLMVGTDTFDAGVYGILFALR